MKGREIATEWRSIDGHAEDLLTVHGRYADLTVVGQADPDATGLPVAPDLPKSVAVATGRGTLVVPYIGAKAPLGRNILLCWNASRESSRAASEALPLLQAAGNVTVLIVEPESSPAGHGAEPGADVATWLSRHGVKVTVQCDVAAQFGCRRRDPVARHGPRQRPHRHGRIRSFPPARDGPGGREPHPAVRHDGTRPDGPLIGDESPKRHETSVQATRSALAWTDGVVPVRERLVANWARRVASRV